MNHNSGDTQQPPAMASPSPLPPAPGPLTSIKPVCKTPFPVYPFERPPKLPWVTVNPFKNMRPRVRGPYEWIKTILCLPLFLIRLILFLLALILGYINARIVLGGAEWGGSPVSPTRLAFLWPTRMCARLVLFALGYHWIEVVGRPAPRDEAPIVVPNHTSFTDPLFFFFHCMPMFVSNKSNEDISWVKPILRVLPVLPVEHRDPKSRREAATEIKRRTSEPGWLRMCLFPEAATTNGKALVSFRYGAFAPGHPIQPVVVRYPYVHYDNCWVPDGPMIYSLLFRMMTQFTNHMQVEYLPVIHPNDKELKDPFLFAERVRFTMAEALNRPVTDHSYGDVRLAWESVKVNQHKATSMVEVALFERLYRLQMPANVAYLHKFAGINTSGSCYFNLEEFHASLLVPPSDITRNLFKHLFDQSERGAVSFREFLNAIAFISKHASFPTAVTAAFKEYAGAWQGAPIKERVLVAAHRRIFPEASEAMAMSFFIALDLDKDGAVSKENFEQFMSDNPEYIAILVTARPDLVGAGEKLEWKKTK